MIDSRLVDYISQGIEAGHSPHRMRQALINAGWPHQQVDEAIRYALSQHIPHLQQPGAQPQAYPQQAYPRQARPVAGQAGPAQQRPMGVLGKFRTVLAHPGQFFDAVKGEQGYEAPVKFYLFLLLIDLIAINAIMLFAASIFLPLSGLDAGLGIGAISLLLLSNLLIANLSVVLSIIGTFIGAGFMHIFAFIFGARKGYQNTYKAMIYSAAPSVLMWPLLGLLLVDLWAAMAAAAAVYIWMLILQIKGLSRLHEISGARAFAIVFAPILIALALMGVVILFVLSIFNPAAYTAGIPTGFAALGVPDDWDLNSNGDFSIILRNSLRDQVEITGVEISLDPATDTYEPSTPIAIGPRSTYGLESSESGLNLGPRTAGASYSIALDITYKIAGSDIMHMDSGTVRGTVG
jgi:hypothetical protein